MPKIYTVIIDGKPCTMTNNSGMTRDEDYYKGACKRFDEATRQEALF